MVFYSLLINIKVKVLKKKWKKLENPVAVKLEKIINDSNLKVARRIIKLLMRLFYKRIWYSKKIINLIAGSMKLNDHKVNLLAARFLISTAEFVQTTIDSDNEEETLKDLTQTLSKKYKFSKKKIEKLEKQIKNVRKKE